MMGGPGHQLFTPYVPISYPTYLELNEMTRESSNRALLLNNVASLLDFGLTQVDKSYSGEIAQSLFPSPLRTVILDKLQSSSRCSGEDGDQLVVVDFRGWCSLSLAGRVGSTYV